MKTNFETLRLPVLQKLFIAETKIFLTAIENGESWEQLEQRRILIKSLVALIDQRSKSKKSVAETSTPVSPEAPDHTIVNNHHFLNASAAKTGT